MSSIFSLRQFQARWLPSGLRTSPLLALTAVFVVSGGLWTFALLADEVSEGDTHEIDERILLALRNPADKTDPLGPPWLEEAARDVTALGGVSLLSIATAAAAGYFVLRKKLRTLGMMLFLVLGGQALSMLLKQLVARPRPQLVPHLSHVYTASFPSGHSVMSAVTYFSLAVLLAQVQSRLVIRWYLWGLALLLVVLVGLSRVYLGVHYPTDVVAGWAIGAAWAALCWLLAQWLQKSGRVEPEPPTQR